MSAKEVGAVNAPTIRRSMASILAGVELDVVFGDSSSDVKVLRRLNDRRGYNLIRTSRE
jgi:hypothetical protein